MMATPQLKVHEEDDDSHDDDAAEMIAPAYKNQLGDALANALAKSVSLKETPKSNGKKKKAKKTLLFASGMNFNWTVVFILLHLGFFKIQFVCCYYFFFHYLFSTVEFTKSYNILWILMQPICTTHTLLNKII